jgi:hypothetical protein
MQLQDISLPEIPQSWLIAFLAFALVILRAFSIDSWVTAALGIVIGYITGKHVERSIKSCESSAVSVPFTFL